eukprot:1160613-Pelagomonas_calceolata.AAC.7
MCNGCDAALQVAGNRNVLPPQVEPAGCVHVCIMQAWMPLYYVLAAFEVDVMMQHFWGLASATCCHHR